MRVWKFESCLVHSLNLKVCERTFGIDFGCKYWILSMLIMNITCCGYYGDVSPSRHSSSLGLSGFGADSSYFRGNSAEISVEFRG